MSEINEIEHSEVAVSEINEIEHSEVAVQEPPPPLASRSDNGGLRVIKESATGFFTNLTIPLADRNFRLYFSGQSLSILGDTFYTIALPWIILSKGGNPQILGIVLAAYGVPRLMTILLGGMLSDQIRPRWIMLGTDFVRAILVGLMAVQVFSSNFSIILFTINVGCLGVFTGLFIPSSYSILPDILPKDKLQAANSMNATLFQLAMIFGYSIAGIVVAHLQLGVALSIDACSFLASVTALAFIRYNPVDAKKREAKKDTSNVGTVATPETVPTEKKITMLNFLRSSRLLQIAILVDTITFLTSGGMMGVALPSFARIQLGAGANGYGLLLIMYGAGELVGSIAAGGLGKLTHRPVILLLLQITQGVAFALFPLMGGIAGISGAAAIMVVAGVINGLINVLYFTLVQQYFPKHLMGRIWGVIMFVTYGVYPLSVLIGGFVTTGFGPSFMFLASGVTLTIGAIVGLSFREIRELL